MGQGRNLSLVGHFLRVFESETQDYPNQSWIHPRVATSYKGIPFEWINCTNQIVEDKMLHYSCKSLRNEKEIMTFDQVLFPYRIETNYHCIALEQLSGRRPVYVSFISLPHSLSISPLVLLCHNLEQKIYISCIQYAPYFLTWVGSSSNQIILNCIYVRVRLYIEPICIYI